MVIIKFDISCFRPDFQEFIFKKLDCNDYFEFINKYQNSFNLNISTQKIFPIPEEDSCTFKNINEFSSAPAETNTENVEVPQDLYDRNVEENIDKIINEINSDESDDEEDCDKGDVKFSHYYENNEIYVQPNKKFFSKRLAKNFKKNGGNWIKQKNIWIFPLSSKQYIEETLASQNNSNLIKNCNQEKDKVIIYPKLDHPKYGVSTIYDKAGNLGIWDNSIKGWIFQKKN